MPSKVLETDTHIYFLTGPFSQWHPSKFWASFRYGGPRYWFNCAEQYMMAGKADLFGDQETFKEIMDAVSPKDQKALGRKVKNFDPEIWDDGAAQEIVFQGNLNRAFQDIEYRTVLINSESKFLVEGSAYDPIWGVGLAWDDPAILNEVNWRGTNFLGHAHMKVRYVVTSCIHSGWTAK